MPKIPKIPKRGGGVVGAFKSGPTTSTQITDGSFTTPILTLDIPSAGKYLVFAKLQASNASQSAPNPPRIDCKLSLGGGGGDLDNSSATLHQHQGSQATISLQTAWEFQASSSVDLYCLSFFQTPIEVSKIRLSAIRVDEMTLGPLQ